MKKIFLVLLLTTVLSTILFASGDSADTTLADESHSKGVDANYEKLFEDTEIQRLDIVIDSETYEAMKQNMVELYGEATGENQSGFEDGQLPPGLDMLGGQMPPEQNTQGGQRPSRENNPGGQMGPPVNGQMPPPINQEDQRPGMDNGENMMDDQFLGSSEEPDFFEATIYYDELVWDHVGIRYKGNSTLKNTWNSGAENLPLRFNFDYYEDEYPETDDQRFYGFKKMTMANMSHDETLIHDKLASDMFNDSGVYVAEAAFYEVYLDSGDGAEFLGLYTMIEDPSDDFLDDKFGNDNGKLYKPEGTAATLSQFEGANYEEKLEGDEDYSEIETLIEHLNNYDMDQDSWRTRFEELFDVESFIKYLAINNSVGNWDTYGGAPHNFYLYSDPEKNGQITFIPWDLNECFSYSNRSISLSMSEVEDKWPLIYRVVNDSEYMKLYYQELGNFITGPFSEEYVTEKVEEYQNLVFSYTAGSEQNFSTNLLSYIQERREAVNGFLNSVGY